MPFSQPSVFDNPEAACENFLWSEKRYVEVDLRTCWDTQKRLTAHISVKRPIISVSEIEKLFANFFSIYQGHVQLLDDLMALRLEGKDYFVKKLGVIMIQFIPFFRMYTDYITRKGERQDALVKLPKKTKKFKEFCELEKEMSGVKLKKLLKAPLERLPQYLRFMAQVYNTFEDKECQPALDILECIQKIAEVTNDIASKAKDMKARRQVGLLQNRLFQNKVKLAIPSRFVVKHEELRMWVVKSFVTVTLVLFNDIIILAMAPAGFMGRCKLESAWPLAGLKVSTEVQDPETDNKPFRFSVSRTKPNGEINTMVVVCKQKEQQDVWVNKIWEWVDRAEHSRRPVNPVQLMRRLRNQKTKGNGSFDTIQITSPEKLREIEAWEELQRKARKSRKKKRASKTENRSTPVEQKEYSSGRRFSSPGKRAPAPPPGPPPRPIATTPPGGKPNEGKNLARPGSYRAGVPPPNPRAKSVPKYGQPKAPPRPPSFNHSSPPSSLPRSLPPQLPPSPPNNTVKATRPAFLGDIGKGVALKKPAARPRKKTGRMGLLGQIQAGKNLKKVKTNAKKKDISSVAGDLESHIARYRKYVCDSDEETKSDSSDDDWD